MKITHRAHRVKEESFTGGNLTIFGGSGLWRRLIEKLGVRNELAKHVPLVWPGRTFSRVDLLICGLWAHICELGRPYHSQGLARDIAFRELSGTGEFPSQSTLSRMLSKMKMEVCEGILRANKAMLLKVRDFGKMESVTLDLDTHVVCCYGDQQRAARGYNPKKPGRKGYHPMLCFIGETRDLLYAKMRGGNDCHISKNESVSFVKKALSGLPIHDCSVRLRADSAFYNYKFFEYLEKKGIEYAVVVRMYPGIQRHLVGLSFTDMGGGLEVGEFSYELPEWERPRRMVVIRQRIVDGKRRGKQLKLLEEDGYTYQAIMTNLSLSPYEVWKFYNGRCNAENFIKEGVYDFGLDHLVSHRYAGNTCWMYLSLLAYNLTNWLKDIGFGEQKSKRMAGFFRRSYLLIAAKMVRSGRRTRFKLSSAYRYQDQFWEAASRVEQFEPVCR